ncbi:type 2 isopentenyl-diphosphate Delta-isomerase [Companilactobacillus metriopterae]|uniref:type 2 isopentenyl-diphosphate Delta-isomerase n=1 Tax=Companilactobacillus metriopterae TaxID=1909267 RepID=UPI00100A48BA|nr:type 2 isopentenyl-diphosphate Delta-isomerase [Companilactobacillus metriopterae]
MPKQDEQIQRKVEHLFLAEKFYDDNSMADFDSVRLLHNALPELSMEDIDLSTNFLGFNSSLPIYFNAITGGSKQSERFNGELAEIAKEFNIPVSSGSMGVYFRIPDTAPTFRILREKNPAGFVIANISGKYNLEQAKQAVDLVDANALQIHINTLQELAMPEGDREFYWLDNISKIVNNIGLPVIVKEVGFGMTSNDMERLINIGVKNIDISGFGGTNFAEIESARNHEFDLTYLDNFALSTVESLLESSKIAESSVNILASGGIKAPLDVIKSLRLGASAVGISGLALHHLQKYSLEETKLFFEHFCQELEILMAAFGAKNILEIKKAPIVFDESLVSYMKQRNINLPS